MSMVLIIILIVVVLGSLVLLAAMLTGLAEKHKSGHLPRKGGAGSKQARKSKAKR